MALLILNAGSSSLKYRLYRRTDLRELAAGTLDGLRPDNGFADHSQAFDRALAAVRAALPQGEALTAIGHRIVHGGTEFTTAARIDDHMLTAIAAVNTLAPLHNPPAVALVHRCRQHFPALPQVAVFDTAFHHTLPEHARRYPLPDSWCHQDGVRRFGFHGISHSYVAQRAAEYLGRNDLKLISLHLGNGASAAAIDSGRCLDTSMGLTPLEGLVMGTRGGDLDPGILFHLMRTRGLTATELENQLTRESGLKALCGSTDMREVQARADTSDPRALLALDIYTYRIRKYIGAYAAVLGGLDTLVFTAGVGENAAGVRARVCDGLKFLGIDLDPARQPAPRAIITPVNRDNASVAVLVIATNEELEIARQTRELLGPPHPLTERSHP